MTRARARARTHEEAAGSSRDTADDGRARDTPTNPKFNPLPLALRSRPTRATFARTHHQRARVPPLVTSARSPARSPAHRFPLSASRESAPPRSANNPFSAPREIAYRHLSPTARHCYSALRARRSCLPPLVARRGGARDPTAPLRQSRAHVRPRSASSC